MIVRDTLVMGPWHDIETRSRTHRRIPMDWDAEHTLLRTVRCVSGTVELVMDCEPAFDYNRASANWEYSASGYGEAVARASHNPDAHPTLRLTTNLRIGLEGRQARARTRLKEGDNVFVALSFSKHPSPQTYEEAADKMWTTSECWRQWINIGNFPDHPWRSYLQRSALTLKGLSLFADRSATGGEHHVAAGNPSGRTQLGLPLRLDSGLDVRAVGSVHAGPGP